MTGRSVSQHGVFSATPAAGRVWASNRYGVDYREVASRLGPPPTPIFDAHLHINGLGAVSVLREAADAFGVEGFLSQTRLDHVPAVREALGDRVRFVAVPNFANPDRAAGFGREFVEHIRVFRREHGARVVKFWNAPRLVDFLPEGTAGDYVEFDAPWRVRAAEVASDEGMMFQCHVADPDTWFATTYRDASRYGTKRSRYASLERMLARFPAPWIAAHCGGWPEDLDFLDGLLGRHGNLCLDLSATKWMVREISKHPRERVVAFLERWRGRVFFGSDIVSTDEHLAPAGAGKSHPMGDLADGPEAAFDLYASRYAALRFMWEGRGDVESPIADPDLAKIDPSRHGPMSAPTLRGFDLPDDLLKDLYRNAALSVLDGWVKANPSG